MRVTDLGFHIQDTATHWGIGSVAEITALFVGSVPRRCSCYYLSTVPLESELLKLQTSQDPSCQPFLENVQYAGVKVQQATR